MDRVRPDIKRAFNKKVQEQNKEFLERIGQYVPIKLGRRTVHYG